MRYRDIRSLIAGNGSASNQIYHILCFSSFFFGMFAAIQSWATGLTPYVVAANFTFSVFFAALYVLSRSFGVIKQSWFAGPVFLIFVYIPVIWICNGGTLSGTSYVVILLDSFIVVLSTGDEARFRERVLVIIAITLLIAVMFFLLWLEYARPELVYSYEDRSARFVDIAASMVIAAVGNFLILRTYVSLHHREYASIQKYTDTLEVLVQTDAMTGLLNHAHGIKRLEFEVSKAHRYGHKLSIVMLDLDFFKRVNDDFGHQTGDDVIMRFSDCIRHCSRVFDVGVRYGGEEFILILPETGLESAILVGERIRARLREMIPFMPTPLTVSGGVVACGPGDTANSMVKRADDLLYRAKNSGRDRILSG